MAPTADVATLDAIFKAYDVRGPGARAARRRPGARHRWRVRRGHRRDEPSWSATTCARTSPGLADAFAEGAAAAGADVVAIGLCATDQLYFASGRLDLPGAMVTASHNPAEYNGIKLCRAGARPVALDTGLAEIRDLVAAGATAPAPRGRARSATATSSRRTPSTWWAWRRSAVAG